ncbi:MAG: L-ribulose-5-phosphate 4-epimerase AraD [Vicinamibacterales bacterium]
MPGFTQLRDSVCRANREIAANGLVFGTFGNLSAVDRGAGVFAIKPSGVAYASLTPDHMVVLSIDTGEVVQGSLKPSLSAPAHLELYRAFTCGAIVHAHSEFAVLFAQSRLGLRCMGTTHADHFHGDIPVTRPMTQAEVDQDYDRNIGLLIVETFRKAGIVPEQVPAVLVSSHVPFAWGADIAAAIDNATALEFIARLEFRSRLIAPDALRPDGFLVDKRYARKHGPKPTYGQK